MFSACGSSTPLNGPIAVARHLLRKTKSSSVYLEGLDLLKVTSCDPNTLRRSESLNDLLKRNTSSVKSLEVKGKMKLKKHANHATCKDVSQQCKRPGSYRFGFKRIIPQNLNFFQMPKYQGQAICFLDTSYLSMKANEWLLWVNLMLASQYSASMQYLQYLQS